MTVNILSTSRVGGADGGYYHRVRHSSTSTGTDMIFGLFLPSRHESTKEPTPVMYWLSGLTCDDTNFPNKAGSRAFDQAEKQDIALVMPDTSPRHDPSVPDVEAYDLGVGAGFYVNATQNPYRIHYQMYTYITVELPSLLEREFKIGMFGLKSISGHSMGGHGALTIAMKDPSSWVSVSAFAPICNPTRVPWGQKAFTAYLGSVEAGQAHDASYILSERNASFTEFDDILIDQGTDDEFLMKQLTTDVFFDVARKVGQKCTINMRKGFDHSYHFVAAFIEDHVEFHGRRLRRKLGKLRSTYSTYDFSSSQGNPIQCRAMVARLPREPLVEEIITVDPPKAGEVRVKVIANALCHRDIYTLDGQDAEGRFPCILGHEAGCIVESVGPGVVSVQPGDHVIPCFTPQCCEATCIFCQNPNTNLCPAIRNTQGKGVMPDGTVRFRDSAGNAIYHFMGCSAMSEYTVVAEVSCAKITKEIALEKACLFGGGVTTGLGAVWNTCKVEVNSAVAVFGLGAVGLAVIQGAKLAGASRIIAVDINSGKFDIAKRLGATDVVNPKRLDMPVQKYISGVLTKWGVNYSFDCTGNVEVMRAAIECCHRGFGTSCVVGNAPAGHEISTRPLELVSGRTWKGTSFGGFKSRQDLPLLVKRSLNGEIPIDHFITHLFDGVKMMNDAIVALHNGDCIRCVVRY